jgi:muramidase (phage lysozyme)
MMPEDGTTLKWELVDDYSVLFFSQYVTGLCRGSRFGVSSRSEGSNRCATAAVGKYSVFGDCDEG